MWKESMKCVSVNSMLSRCVGESAAKNKKKCDCEASGARSRGATRVLKARQVGAVDMGEALAVRNRSATSMLLK